MVGIFTFLRKIIPFPLRVWIDRVRGLRSLRHVFGRFSSGGMTSYISMGASARRWRHVQVGRASIVERGTHLHSNDDGNGKRIIFDENCFIGPNCFFSAGELIHVKKNCVIGASCNLLAAGHVYDRPMRPYARADVVSYGPMVVGPNVWIGVGSTLLGGVQVGFGTIVAAGTFLRHSVPPLCMVAGNPGRVIKVFDWDKCEWNKLPVDQELHEAALADHVLKLPAISDYLLQLEV